MGEHLVTERKCIYRSCRATKGFFPLERRVFTNRKKKKRWILAERHVWKWQIWCYISNKRVTKTLTSFNLQLDKLRHIICDTVECCIVGPGSGIQTTVLEQQFILPMSYLLLFSFPDLYAIVIAGDKGYFWCILFNDSGCHCLGTLFGKTLKLKPCDWFAYDHICLNYSLWEFSHMKYNYYHQLYFVAF